MPHKNSCAVTPANKLRNSVVDAHRRNDETPVSIRIVTKPALQIGVCNILDFSHMEIVLVEIV
jgi:hypothetical protein